MREEIENSLNEAFNNINPSLNDIYQNPKEEISNLVENQNTKTLEEIEYRKELFNKLEEIKSLGFIVEYNDNMTNEELEDIINSIQY